MRRSPRYVIVYDLGRFSFEFVRGDADRPYLAGFSEAQWTSALLMVIVVAAEAYGVLPFHAWHAIATGAIAVVAIVAMWRRAATGLTRDGLLHPGHVGEVARALDDAPSETRARHATSAVVRVARTSLGVQLSTGMAGATTHAGAIHHYTISWTDGQLSADAARTWRI